MEFLFSPTVDEIKERLDATGLEIVLHNLPPATGTRRRALASPATRPAWMNSTPAYPRPSPTPRPWACRSSQLPGRARRRPASMRPLLPVTFVGNLRFAVAALKGSEPAPADRAHQPFDIPGFYLNRTDQALSILDEVGADNAFVQYDRHLPRAAHR